MMQASSSLLGVIIDSFWRKIIMKHLKFGLFTLGITFILMTSLVSAEDRYVIDNLQITFRTGPGNDRKIISLLNSDQKVEIIAPNGDWVKVRLQNGKEGWVLQRYLTRETPCRTRVALANQSIDQLENELDATQKTSQQILADKEKISQDLKRTQQELDEKTKAYATLKKGAAGYLELKDRHQKMSARLTQQTQKADELDLELNTTRKKKYVRWFLGGAGVLLLGFILGFSSKKQKRHSSLV